LIDSESTLTKNVFQETATISRRDISLLDDFPHVESVLQIVYEYNPLWSSFRPTLWVWALAIVGCTVVFLWKRPKAPAHVIAPVAAMKLGPEFIKSFVEAYEEKTKITFDMDSLENKVRKGKIPRRRYKVQRKTLETRLNTLSRNLAELKERMHAAGGQYVQLMRQLEIAETEINEVEANIKSIEARHSRGELSLEAYRKLLTDYQHRKERADTTIKGILLRLREEIR
jgi:predicted nuclease with TOPRIM domain